jgi:hypothetical protein
MAVEEGFLRQERLPPNFVAQMFSGVPGQNVPGIMPLLNQEMVNRMMGFGVAGANPYTYQGERIAGFTPAQQEAMRLSAEGVGSYSPYLARSEAITEGALADLTDSYGRGSNLLQQSIAQGSAPMQEGLGMLRQAADVGAGATQAFTPGDITPFSNQYQSQVVDQALDDVSRRLAETDISNRAMAIGKGAGFGDRSGIQRSDARADIARGAMQGIGGLRMQAEEAAANRAQTSFENQQARQANQARLLGSTAGGMGALGGGLGNLYGNVGKNMFGIGAQTGQLAGNLGAQIGNLGGAQQGLMGTDIARLYGAGGQQQNLAQQGLDLAYGNFVGGYNLPLQSIGQIGQLAAGFAPSLGGTTIQQTSQSNPSNPLMQAAGTALAAYGAMQGQPQRVPGA